MRRTVTVKRATRPLIDLNASKVTNKADIMNFGGATHVNIFYLTQLSSLVIRGACSVKVLGDKKLLNGESAYNFFCYAAKYRQRMKNLYWPLVNGD